MWQDEHKRRLGSSLTALSIMETNINTNTNTNTNERAIGNYSGKYADAQNDIFTDLQEMFGIEERQADLIAYRFASDFGKLTAGTKVETKLGKVNKKGI